MLLAACLLSQALAAQEPEEQKIFKGFSITNKKDGSKLEFHGKFQNDWAAFVTGEGVRSVAGPFPDGTEIRRVRFSFGGVLYDWLEFQTSVDLAGDGTALRDAWVETADLGPPGNLRLGQFKEPFGLEQLGGSGDLTFLERSVGSTLTPGRNIGLMCSSPFAEKRGTWALGLFHEDVLSNVDQGTGSGSGVAATGRLTYLPWYGDDGRRLAHFGLDASVRSADRIDTRFKAEPEIHLAPNIVDTKSFDSSDMQMLAGEGGLVWGAASLQAEYFLTHVSIPLGEDATFPGYYLQASYFLTGEARGYSRSSGHFTAPKLLSRFDGDGDSMGAWEIAARYSRLNLDSAAIFGGDVRDVTLGLNWYINETMKVQVNYVYSELESFGNVQGMAIRFQLDW